MKTCSRCKQQKALVDFSLNSAIKDGRSIYCRVCTRIMVAKSAALHPESKHAWRNRNRAKVLATMAAWKKANPERYARGVIENNWKRQGIKFTWEERAALLVAQQNCCAVCRRTETDTGQRLAVDHNHQTGAIRGLLCATCNRFVVKVIEDHDALIDRARRYLNGASIYQRDK